jgi:hypothetical protein
MGKSSRMEKIPTSSRGRNVLLHGMLAACHEVIRRLGCSGVGTRGIQGLFLAKFSVNLSFLDLLGSTRSLAHGQLGNGQLGERLNIRL